MGRIGFGHMGEQRVQERGQLQIASAREGSGIMHMPDTTLHGIGVDTIQNRRFHRQSGLPQIAFRLDALKACPGIGPRIGGIGPVISDGFRNNEKGLALFEVIGTVPRFENTLAIKYEMNEVMISYGRPVIMLRPTLL